ncbi:MAG: alpha/beta fold hydrolase, partial [Planctomycetales bacterium]|nr:alpha/beta fold hydrolase [Planctomycetales bacterium]
TFGDDVVAVLAAGDAGPAEVMIPKLLAPRTLEFGGPVVARLMEMIGRASPQGIAAAQLGMAVRPDVRDQLGQIECPALVLAGAEDVISPPAEMAEIAAALPNGRFVEIPTAGHMTPLENPGDVNAALAAFLDELP